MAILLVLTATITPPIGVPNLRRADPALRREDYRRGLTFYLKQPSTVIDRIVFLENSNSDVSDFRDLVQRQCNDKKVEILAFDGLDHPPAYGRGYGEFKMLDIGFQRSEELKALQAQEVFWKVTGRLRVLNIADLIRSAPRKYQLLADFRYWPQKAVDWRIMSCTREGYQQLYEGQYALFREDARGMAGESYDFARLVGCTNELGIVPRYPRQPKIAGVSGEHNWDYYEGSNVVKYWIRAVARRVAPHIWI
jgi:hypothetical protein